MKRQISLLLALALALSLAACGAAPSNETEPTSASATQEASAVPIQLIADSINSMLLSDTFTQWRQLYAGFHEKKPDTAVQVTDITHYQIADFEGAKVECYLVCVAAEYSRWIDQDAQQGITESNLYFYIDPITKVAYDHVSIGAGDPSDLSTEEGRAAYLVGFYAQNLENGAESFFVNDRETQTSLPEDTLAAVNSLLVTLSNASIHDPEAPVAEENSEAVPTEVPETIPVETQAVSTAQPIQEESPRQDTSGLTDAQKLIADSVNALLASDTFAQWQTLYEDFSGSKPNPAQITDALHYQIGDFDGERMDCYLVNIAADVAFWYDEAAQQGSIESGFQLFIDTNTGTVYDSITTDAVNFSGDTSTFEGKAIYLMWMYGSTCDGSSSGPLLNSAEFTTPLSQEDLSAINQALSQP